MDGQVEVVSGGTGPVHLRHQAGSLGSWASASAPGISMVFPLIWSYGNRVLVSGAGVTFTATQTLDSIFYADVSGGVLGAWSQASATLPYKSRDGGAARWGHWLYMAGGMTSGSGSTTPAVYGSPLDANGLPTGWTSLSALPFTEAEGRLVADYGRLYYFRNAPNDTFTYSAAVYSAPIQPDGSLGAWALEGAQRTQARRASGISWGMGRFFSVGGETASWVGETTVDQGPLGASGVLGAFTAPTNLPAGRSWNSGTPAAFAGRLYQVGGKTYGGTDVEHPDVYSSPMGAGGALGAWVTEGSLPTGLADHGVAEAGGQLFALLGVNPGGASLGVYQAALNQGASNCAQGVYVNEFDLGSDQWVNQLNWVVSPSTGATVQVRSATSAGSYSAWSSAQAGGSASLGVSARYVEYRVLLQDVPGNEVTLSQVSLDQSTPTITPTFSASPTFSVSPTATPTRTVTLTITPTVTPTATPTASPTVSPSPSVTLTRVFTPAPSPVATSSWGLHANTSDFGMGSMDGQVEVLAGATGPVHLMRQAGSLGGWADASSDLAVPLGAAGVWTRGGRIIVAGGNDGVTTYADLEYADVVNGALGPWTVLPNAMPAASNGASVALWANWAYVAVGSATSTQIYRSALDVTGLPGAWTAVASLPAGWSFDYGPHLVADYGRLVYLPADPNGVAAATTAVYSAPINPDGSLGAWVLEAGSARPGVSRAFAAGMAMGSLLQAGGETNGNWNGITSVFRAPFSAAGALGAFGTANALPQPRSRDSLGQVAWAGRLYQVGGKTYSGVDTPHVEVYSAPLSAGGVVGTWGAEASLPLPQWSEQVAAVGGQLFVVGGSGSAACLKKCYQASLSQGAANAAQGVYVNRFDLGSDSALGQLIWALSPSNGGTLQYRWAASAGAWSAWSAPLSGGSAALGVTARYLEYRVLLQDVPGSDVSLTKVQVLQATPTPSATPSASPTVSATATPSSTPTRSATVTASPTVSPTPSATPDVTALPSAPDTPGDCKAYPSPAHGDLAHFVFKVEGPGRGKLRVWNSAGQLSSTIEDVLSGGSQAFHLHIHDYAPGVYLYQLELDYDDGRTVQGPVKRFAVIP
jgi:hypothetical protein